MPPSGPLLPLFLLPHMHACTHTHRWSLKPLTAKTRSVLDDALEMTKQKDWLNDARRGRILSGSLVYCPRHVRQKSQNIRYVRFSSSSSPTFSSSSSSLSPVLFFKKCCRSTISFLCLLSSHSFALSLPLSFAPLLFSLSIPPSSPPFLLSSLPSLPSLLPPTVYGTLKFTRK